MTASTSQKPAVHHDNANPNGEPQTTAPANGSNVHDKPPPLEDSPVFDAPAVPAPTISTTPRPQPSNGQASQTEKATVDEPKTQTPPEMAPPNTAKTINGHTEKANGDVGGALEKQDAQVDGEQVKKRRNMLTRTLWTFIMIGVFLSASGSIAWTVKRTDSVMLTSAVAHGTCIYGRTCHDLPNAGIPRGHGTLLAQEERRG